MPTWLDREFSRSLLHSAAGTGAGRPRGWPDVTGETLAPDGRQQPDTGRRLAGARTVETYPPADLAGLVSG
jgi:hypothetical protein